MSAGNKEEREQLNLNVKKSGEQGTAECDGGPRKSFQIYKGNKEWKETGADAEKIVWIRMMLQGQHENMMPLCMCPKSTGMLL